TAACSVSFASCWFAWCWQKRSSSPEGSLARTRAAAPQRSQRSALVSSGLVRVAFMGSPFSCIHCLRRIRFSRCSPIVIGCVVSHELFTRVRRGSLQWATVTFAPGVFVHLCGATEWVLAPDRGAIHPHPAPAGVIPLSAPDPVH